MRVGLGYDIHRLIGGKSFRLGGVLIPCDKGPVGHSDGDCLYHAVTEALLGAAGLGDIGHYFPDTDARWKGADSAVFIRETVALLQKRGFQIGNIDANLLLESPRLSPHLEKMRGNLSELLAIPIERINLKARRGEGVDAVGKGDAVVCQVIALLTEK